MPEFDDSKPKLSKFPKSAGDLTAFLQHADQTLFNQSYLGHLAGVRYAEPEMYCFLASLSAKMSKH